LTPGFLIFTISITEIMVVAAHERDRQKARNPKLKRFIVLHMRGIENEPDPPSVKA